MPRLYLIDSLYYAFRAYYALPRSLKSDVGVPTNAVYGFIGSLRSLFASRKVEAISCVFESLTGTFREEIEASYKAHREPPPEELLQQLPLIEEVCGLLGLQLSRVEGYEADDVIACLAQRANSEGWSVSILSNDKDLAQILACSERIELLRAVGRKGELRSVTMDQVPEVFGVRAEQIPSFLALRGDPVDNIAGLKGVGDKTAQRLLGQADDLHALLESPELAGPRWCRAVQENRAALLRDLELATVRYDLSTEQLGLTRGWEPFRLAPVQIRPLLEFYREHSMNSHRQRLERALEALPSGFDAAQLFAAER